MTGAGWRPRSVLGLRLTRYTAGSVVATVVGQATFVLLYGPLGVGPRASSVLAFLAGAIPNYYLNRNWTWGRRGRSRLVKEVLPYAAIVLCGVVVATVAAEVIDAQVVRIVDSRLVQVLVVWLGFAVVNGLLFIAKFLLFDRVLFDDRRRRDVAARKVAPE